MASYDYEVRQCSVCLRVVECVYIWSNVTPWLCQQCCEERGHYWTREQEDADNDE